MGLLRLIPRIIILPLKVSIIWRMIEAVRKIGWLMKKKLTHFNFFVVKRQYVLKKTIGIFSKHN